ncbi:uncharacterized protein LOC109599923 [Aethina tumida]|uniref:uncharacterized protein LOC109599923 n=1 Tax=Aethina tumida TaxID=116153 RepID=UPI00096B5E34|nr:uncharacterized protein LOC109599923 [Aethina tumida]
MLNMIITTPYRNFDVRDKSPPRIISEIRKSYASCNYPNIKTKITADVLMKCGGDGSWWPRRIHIRGGQLHVSGAQDGGPTALRIPLRHLSLQTGPIGRSLSLCRGDNVILTLQARSEKEFDQCVKTIAIELIRQTPLDAVKYLDILTIADCWKRQAQNCEKDWNYNYLKDANECADNDEVDAVQNTSSHSEPIPVKDPDVPVVEEKAVEDLLKKCQNVENYVPVKDKLFLFESLCKLGRKVRSTEDVSNRVVPECCAKRARSMHDLSNLNTHIAVREICKYFENKSEYEETKKVETMRTRRRFLNPSDNVYTFRKVMTT